MLSKCALWFSVIKLVAWEHEILSNSYSIKAGTQLGLPPNIIYLSITVPTPSDDVSWFRFNFGCSEQDVRRRFLMEMFIFSYGSRKVSCTEGCITRGKHNMKWCVHEIMTHLLRAQLFVQLYSILNWITLGFTGSYSED